MIKILHMDDNESYRLLVEEELREEGYHVIGYDSPHEGLEKIAEENPDMLLLDIRFPNHNGLDFLHKLREDHYNLPVILFSAYEEFREDMKSIAADSYVTKSDDLTRLKSEMNRVLDL